MLIYVALFQCMLWSWYMANDTQFYIIGILLLLVSVRLVAMLLAVTLICHLTLALHWITSKNTVRRRIFLFEILCDTDTKVWRISRVTRLFV
jgi:peptidoglycan/LPS O-acetylase OafA/YrhL